MAANNLAMTGKDVWVAVKRHPKKAFNWLGFNVGIGLLTVWLAYLFSLLSSSVPGPIDKVRKGDLIIFAVTLCASSMSVFAEIKQEHFKDMKEALIWIAAIFVALASAVGAFVSAPADASSFGINSVRVVWLSLPIFGIGVILSFILYAMRLTLETYSYADEKKEEIAEITNTANTQNKTSDNKKL